MNDIQSEYTILSSLSSSHIKGCHGKIELKLIIDIIACENWGDGAQKWVLKRFANYLWS